MYDTAQWRCIAREVARSGGHISRAIFYLQANYEGFESIRPKTIKRLLKKGLFETFHVQQEQLLDQAQLETELETEKARSKAMAFCKNANKQTAAETIRQIRQVAKEGCDTKSLGVLLDYLQFLDHK